MDLKPARFLLKILRHIYKTITENSVWQRRNNFELYTTYQDPDIVKFSKIGRLRWIGHVQRMEEDKAVNEICSVSGKETKRKPKGQKK